MTSPPIYPQRNKKNRARYATTKPRKNRSAKFYVAVSLAALIGMIAFAVHQPEEQPDEHYVRAKELVEDYEYGKSVEARNYTHPVYERALADLKLVDPGSMSAVPARELADEIELKKRMFAKTIAAEQNALAERRQKQRQRQAEVYHRRTLSRLNPVTEFPECDDEETAKAAEDHEHRENDS